MDRESKSIEMLLVAVMWLECADDAAAAGRRDVIAGACASGIRRLESILAYLGGGPVPDWYKDYKVTESMEAPEGARVPSQAAAMSNHVISG